MPKQRRAHDACGGGWVVIRQGQAACVWDPLVLALAQLREAVAGWSRQHAGAQGGAQEPVKAPVTRVAIVLEYFFRMVSAYLQGRRGETGTQGRR